MQSVQNTVYEHLFSKTHQNAAKAFTQASLPKETDSTFIWPTDKHFFKENEKSANKNAGLLMCVHFPRSSILATTLVSEIK